MQLTKHNATEVDESALCRANSSCKGRSMNPSPKVILWLLPILAAMPHDEYMQVRHKVNGVLKND